jgi:hypothetical protein
MGKGVAKPKPHHIPSRNLSSIKMIQPKQLLGPLHHTETSERDSASSGGLNYQGEEAKPPLNAVITLLYIYCTGTVVYCSICF